MTAAKVLIVMGSDSDVPIMQSCFTRLQAFGIPFEAHICSAHRTPDEAARLSRDAEKNGFSLIIAAAGMAAHLPGVLAAFTVLPIIAVPLASGPLNGVDALLAEVQMPSGVPVATVAINGAANAAILAAQILATADPELRQQLHEFKAGMAKAVHEKDAKLQEQLRQQA